VELWWTEQQTPDQRIGLRCSAVLERRRSPYQEVAVYQTAQYGRLLALDDVVMTTEADEFIYHEMLTHPALLTCPQPERVLIVGGGDGGAVREVCRHGAVRRIVLAELDGDVVDVCRRQLPGISCALDDPRVEIRIGDGVEFVAAAADASFDVILVDSPDPVGPATVLYGDGFYADCARVLAPHGVLAAQSESPVLLAPALQRVQAAMRAAFPLVGLYLAPIPTYPSGLWSFSIASKGRPLDLPADVPALPTRYWSPAIQRAAFVLPPFVQDLLREAGQ
jgi:spermidine synthase